MRDRSGFANALAKLLGYNVNGASPDSIAPRFSNPVTSETTGNDNFGFSVLPVKGQNFNDCVIMTHGSFQQRGQGGTSQFTINKFGAKVRVQPNKPDLGDDTCWTQISTRTGVVYSQAFFNSGISIRGFSKLEDGVTPDLKSCILEDGGPPVIVDGGVPQFDPTGTVRNIRHRISSHPRTEADRGKIIPDQRDFLQEAGGLDLALSINPNDTEYLYALNTPVPFSTGQNGTDDWMWLDGLNSIAIFRVIENCEGEDTIWDQFTPNPDGSQTFVRDDCRPGDLQLIGRVNADNSDVIPGSAFGIAAW